VNWLNALVFHAFGRAVARPYDRQHVGTPDGVSGWVVWVVLGVLLMLAAGQVSAQQTTATVVDDDPEGVVSYNAVATLADGRAVLAYVVNTPEFPTDVLRLAVCADAACSSSTQYNLANDDQLFAHVELNIIDGVPVVHYATDTGGGSVFVAECSDITCSTVTTNEVLPGAANSTHEFAVIVRDGTPLIAHYGVDEGASRVELALCKDVQCSNPDVKQLDSRPLGGSTLGFVSIALDTQGRPLVAYSSRSDSTQDIRLAACDDTECESVQNVLIAERNDGSISQETQLGLAGDNPVIAFADLFNDLYLVRCKDRLCSTQQSAKIVDTGLRRDDVDMAVVGGTALIAYSSSGRTVPMLECNDTTCTQINEVVGGSLGRSNDLHVNGADVHISTFDGIADAQMYALLQDIIPIPTLARFTLGTGGRSGGGNFLLDSTIAQPLAGRSSNVNNVLQIGFWQQAGAVLFPAFDLDQDGLITSTDVVYVINRLGGDLSADVDGDGDVDQDDVQQVLDNLGDDLR
jgi:hypothetical protein